MEAVDVNGIKIEGAADNQTGSKNFSLNTIYMIKEELVELEDQQIKSDDVIIKNESNEDQEDINIENQELRLKVNILNSNEFELKIEDQLRHQLQFNINNEGIELETGFLKQDILDSKQVLYKVQTYLNALKKSSVLAFNQNKNTSKIILSNGQDKLKSFSNDGYSCSICNKKFSFMLDFNKHLLEHSGANDYRLTNYCGICKKRFLNLTDHLRMHYGEKALSCGLCKNRFSRESTLRRHLLQIHSGYKYNCEICKKDFSDRSNLRAHLLWHSGYKRYQCELCKKQFSTTSNLKNHLRTHSGDRPYSCDVCKKRFSMKSHLIGHLRTHSGAKPYCCKFCGLKFAQTSSLNRHLRTHTR